LEDGTGVPLVAVIRVLEIVLEFAVGVAISALAVVSFSVGEVVLKGSEPEAEG